LSGAFRSEKMVLALLESATQAIISIDGRGRIVLANQRAIELFGYSREELMNARIELLLPESRRSAHTRQRDQYLANPQTRPMGIGMDLAGRRKDGTEFPVEIGLSYLTTPDGNFAIAFVTDISKRKELEQQLLHAQKMEAVGRLAGGVAHDFNNMLTVIAGYNRMILDEVSPMDPLRGYAEEILKASDRAAALTNQLLSFSRRQLLQPRVVEVKTIVQQVEKMLRRLIGEDIELLLQLSPDTCNIYVDPGQVEQILVNLVVNARDAMPLGGRVTIETGLAALDDTYARTHSGVKPGEFAMIAVTDTGHGMDAETRMHIFEPFFTTKPQGQGTGLGLATVYGIVKQSGGDIWVYSELQRGTTFKLYFPRVSSEPQSEAPESDERLVHGSETIVLVEDEESVRNLTVKLLRQLGYRILIAANGEEALKIAKSHTDAIDLLLTDIVMPNMSGKQLSEEFLHVHPETAVLFVSGYTENTVVHHRVLEAGGEFLPKPFSREILAKKIREVLIKNRTK
jgi:two-component system cell cycle sensor histidine kinase/response regulator CckA